MANCVDDCLYYKVCSDFRGNICDKDLARFIDYRMTSDGLCEHFKNKADVVEIVRCKDCIYNEIGNCKHKADYFCANGTPKGISGKSEI